MHQVIHRANSRGTADHDWLKSAHSFSFASYYNPDRMGFGLLRVLNDDLLAPGKGFDTHPHHDMEIVSIPLQGSLLHKDSEGHEQTVKQGEVQLMSAGTGVFHSEYNASQTEEVNFLQIWVIPKTKATAPRYDQKHFNLKEREGKFQTIVSPIGSNEAGVKINQQAYFSLIDLLPGHQVKYQKKESQNGIYLFVVEGNIIAHSIELMKRDGLGIAHDNGIGVESIGSSQLLIMEVPLQ